MSDIVDRLHKVIRSLDWEDQRHVVTEAADEIEHLRLQLQAQKAEWHKAYDIAMVAQYREQQLREALDWEREFQKDLGHDVSTFAANALNQPKDNTPLEELVAKAGEAMRGRMLEPVARAIYTQWSHLPEYVVWVDGGNSIKQDQARNLSLKAIHTIPGVKLEDLK